MINNDIEKLYARDSPHFNTFNSMGPSFLISDLVKVWNAASEFFHFDAKGDVHYIWWALFMALRMLETFPQNLLKILSNPMGIVAYQGYVMIFLGICPYPLGPNTLSRQTRVLPINPLQPKSFIQKWANTPQYRDPSLANGIHRRTQSGGDYTGIPY